MAASLSACTVPCFNSKLSRNRRLRLSSPTTTIAAAASSASYLYLLQFPAQTSHYSGVSTSSSRRRILPLVEAAKKQTFSTFDDLLAKSEKPVLVDFYATWCGPCQFMVPILEEVSTRLGDKIQVAKIDTEKYVQIANKYGIEALPTFILFKDGKPIDRFEGALTANQLIERIESSLKVKQ